MQKIGATVNQISNGKEDQVRLFSIIFEHTMDGYSEKAYQVQENSERAALLVMQSRKLILQPLY